MVSSMGLPSGIAGKSLHMYSTNSTQYPINAPLGAFISTLPPPNDLVCNMPLVSDMPLVLVTVRSPEESHNFNSIFRNYIQSVEARKCMIRKLNATKHLHRIDPSVIKHISDNEVESALPDVSSFMNMVLGGAGDGHS